MSGHRPSRYRKRQLGRPGASLQRVSESRFELWHLGCRTREPMQFPAAEVTHAFRRRCVFACRLAPQGWRFFPRTQTYLDTSQQTAIFHCRITKRLRRQTHGATSCVEGSKEILTHLIVDSFTPFSVQPAAPRQVERMVRSPPQSTPAFVLVHELS